MAIQNVDLWIDELRGRLKADRIVVCLSDPDRNFRKDILPTYKGNRDPSKVPIIRADLHRHLLTAYPSKWKAGLEADDVMGIIATNPKLYPGAMKIIATMDKDLQTVPGYLYNWKRGEMRRVTEHDADYFHLFQTLTGDLTDGYSGCPGIGPVRAAAILDPNGKGPFDPELGFVEWAWGEIVAAYEKRGLTEEDALVQARVARILRHQDFNYKTQEPKLWQPPSSSKSGTASAS